MSRNKIIYIMVAFFTGIMLFVMIGKYAEIRGIDRPIVKDFSAIAEAKQLSAASVAASQAVLVDGTTGEILFGKNPHQKAYPASTTKIMTALVALEICEEQGISLDQKVIIPKEATLVEGSSIYLKAGEKIKIRDLLYGMMLRSGNDAATAVAMTLGGSYESFIRRMNQCAQSLGCENTNFLNPTGLFDENHYTTASDLARISVEAMKNQDFRKIVSCKSWETSGEGESYRVFNNKNKTVYQYEGATGIKIGYTKSSGRTLVASSARGEHQLICVVLNDGNWFNDAYSLMDYGYEVLSAGSRDEGLT